MRVAVPRPTLSDAGHGDARESLMPTDERPLLTVEYNARNFDLAWEAVERGQPLDVVARGWRVPILRRSMPLCVAFFGRQRRASPHTAAEKLRMAVYGWFSAGLFGIYNHAIIAGMTADWRQIGGQIVVSFRPQR
jgi:hypothetical protein